ncbi:hypothetical protein BGX34_003108, partial [Mortierella sp. NVP85]
MTRRKGAPDKTSNTLCQYPINIINMTVGSLTHLGTTVLKACLNNSAKNQGGGKSRK